MNSKLIIPLINYFSLTSSFLAPPHPAKLSVIPFALIIIEHYVFGGSNDIKERANLYS